MDRKQFLKTCASGLCACAVAGIAGKAARADAPTPDDWKVPFARRRYAKLLDILSGKLNEAEMSDALHSLGEFCAADSVGAKLESYRGDVDGFVKFLGQLSQGSVKMERLDTGYLQTFTPGDGDCSCPLISRTAKTPGVVCECSIGWAHHVWRQVLEREPNVVLKESVLRGGKACVSEVRFI